MNRSEYLKTFKAITEQMYKTTEAKSNDYSAGDDPFMNFKAVEYMNVATTEQGMFTRMTDKLMRLGTFVRSGVLKVKNEKIEDTLLDLAVYSVIMICYLRSKK